MVGCKIIEDPNTGQTSYQVDPNKADEIEGYVETGLSIGELLIPILGATTTGILGVLGGLFSAWKKVKPRLITAQSESRMYYTAVVSLVDAIEAFKNSNTEDWGDLKEVLEKAIAKTGLDASAVENIIRAIRGLDPLEETTSTTAT